MKEVDAFTIAQEPIASIDLMERAAAACTRRLLDGMAPRTAVTLLCGMGNNGGDGLAMARLLHEAGCPVSVIVLRHRTEGGPDFLLNEQRIRALSLPLAYVSEGEELPAIDPGRLLIDALLGTGLQRPVTGWLKRMIGTVNGLPNRVLSIDLPSGLFAEDNSGNDPEAIVKADRTLTLELPKLALFLPGFGPFAGRWEVVPIGLDPAFIRSLEPVAAWVDTPDVAAWMPVRDRFSHKGVFGHAWVMAGGPGRMGAALLAVGACLRSGAGLVTARVPHGQEALFHAAHPEAMVSVDEPGAGLSTLPRMERATAVGIGPGIGTGGDTARLLKRLIQEAPAPLVIDADALNLLAENRTWLAFLPAGTILTPHPKEFERLAGPAASDHERLLQARDMAVRFRVVLVLKGAFTAVCAPDGRIFFNATGNPGMAKGGSGDVLTGILTGLLAQGTAPLAAALLGVHAHGLAGDLAAQELGMDGMLPGDLIRQLPFAWQRIREATKDHAEGPTPSAAG